MPSAVEVLADRLDGVRRAHRAVIGDLMDSLPGARLQHGLHPLYEPLAGAGVDIAELFQLGQCHGTFRQALKKMGHQVGRLRQPKAGPTLSLTEPGQQPHESVTSCPFTP
ncbi:hypothetical protein [Streptomyces sp. W16]|uniref:hypothetical protein n=1 Tax=Streptomyces sp. W16 TaxID=3076631 RepID=UPI00295C1DE8|nr:hypothetical protein [Streptomyces sp. W16]